VAADRPGEGRPRSVRSACGDLRSAEPHLSDLGARRLRDILDAPLLSADPIIQRQQAVQWLDRHDDQRIRVMASALPLRGRSGHLDRLVGLLHRAHHPPAPALSKGIKVWSLCCGLFCGLVVVQVVNAQYHWIAGLGVLMALNGLIRYLWRAMLRNRNDAASAYIEMAPTLTCLHAHAGQANRDLPDQTALHVLKGCFHEVVTQGRIPALCGWLEWASLGGMIWALLNYLVFYDFHVAEAVLRHIASNRDILLRGLSATAELEALTSLACLAAEQPVACYPRPATETTIEIMEGRHPLVPEAQSTANGIRLTPDHRTWVITGPNAAGKSTFLRMVGVNVLMAQIGTAAAAADMRWSPVRLMTDVRIRDDLARHESYFLSEVRRLRRMVLDADRSTPILGLIDEPFRGTNSQERVAGGIALIDRKSVV